MANKKNLATTTLSSAIATTDTNLPVVDTGVMPSAPFYATIMPAVGGTPANSGNSEIVYVTSVSDGALVVDRAARGTISRAFNDGDVVTNGIYVEDELVAGDHIDITGNTIKATGYVASDEVVATSETTAVVTNSMIADGTITAAKTATGEFLKLTLSSSDIGEGAALDANTLYGVYT